VSERVVILVDPSLIGECELRMLSEFAATLPSDSNLRSFLNAVITDLLGGIAA
jgi:hypothetical protein